MNNVIDIQILIYLKKKKVSAGKDRENAVLFYF